MSDANDTATGGTVRITQRDELEVSVHYSISGRREPRDCDYTVHAGTADRLIVDENVAAMVERSTGLDLKHGQYQCAAEVVVRSLNTDSEQVNRES